MNRYSAGHQKLRLNVLLLPILPFVVMAAIFPETTYQISLPELLVLFFLGIAIHLGLVVVHELGHVVAAALFRIPLRGFTIGHWRRLVSFKICGVSVDIRAVPDVGYVVPAVKASHMRIAPLAVFLLGGAVAEAVVFFVVFHVNAPAELRSFGDAAAIFARDSTLWFSGCHMFFNLLPQRGLVGGDALDTDGKQLLNLWRQRGELPKMRDLAERFAPVQACFAAKRHAEARELLLPLARDYPDHLGITESLGQACALSGDTVAAEKIFRQLLGRYEDNKLKKAELLDWLICLALFRDRPDLLEEAKGWMAAALLYAPDALTLKGTKAAMEVTLGNYDTAISTIPTLMKRVEMDADRAYLAAALAEAYAAKGQMIEARRWLQIALAAETDNPGVKRAVKKLAAAPVV